MIARDRGEARVHSRWRPAPPNARLGQPVQPGRDGAEMVARARAGPWRSRGLIVVVAVVVATIGGAVIVGRQHARRRVSIGLPATPRQWVDDWTAAAIESPARVCGQLFAPALAAAFRADTGQSCVAYYGSVTSGSFRIRHVLRDGPTAAVEAQQVGAGRQWGYFTMILSQVRAGWQAVDVVPGGSVRPR